MRASLLFDNQWDVYIVDAGWSKEKPALYAAPQTRTTCAGPGSFILPLIHQLPSLMLQTLPSPSPWEKPWKLKDSKTHVVSHKTSHALCENNGRRRKQHQATI